MFPFTKVSKNSCLSSWDRPALPVGNGEKMVHLHLHINRSQEARELQIDVMLMDYVMPLAHECYFEYAI